MEFNITIGKDVLLEALNKNKSRYVDTREVIDGWFKKPRKNYKGCTLKGRAVAVIQNRGWKLVHR